MEVSVLRIWARQRDITLPRQQIGEYGAWVWLAIASARRGLGEVWVSGTYVLCTGRYEAFKSSINECTKVRIPCSTTN